MHGYEKSLLQSFFPDHIVASNCADQDYDKHNLDRSKRKGGTALIWRKELDDRIELIYEGTSRIQAIQLRVAQNEKITIVNTYMPSHGSENHSQKYQELLEETREVLVENSKYHFIWLGDLNGSTLRSTYSHDRLLQNFLREMELTPAGICNDMTFHHFNGKSQSQIDYIMVSRGLHHSCHGYRVRQREPTNVSAHDPVHVTISLNTQIKPNVQKKIPSTKPRPRWESTDLEIYHDLSHSRIQNLISSSDEMSLEQFIEELSKTLTETAEEAAPPRRKSNNRRKKPWTPKMTAILRELKHFFWRWKSEGRPKDDNPTFRRLQALKKQLRQA